jgi:hypothetical protein
MGLTRAYLDFIETAITRAGIPDGAAMCELGNQRIGPSVGIPQATGKEYFSPRFTHTSLDLNGLDGAIPVDLSRAIRRPELIGRFDVLTNSGTSEHVSDQYACFFNVHELVRAGGVMIHLVPKTGNWRRHSTVYYTVKFFTLLASANGYGWVSYADIATRGPESHLICVALRKKRVSQFIGRDTFDGLAEGTLKSA